MDGYTADTQQLLWAWRGVSEGMVCIWFQWMITWKNKKCFKATKACQEGPQEGPQNSNLSYLDDSFKVFERVLQFQPQKLSGEESDLKIGTAAMESLLCLCAMSKNQMAVTFSSLRRKGTRSEGQEPKGWVVVWLCADPSGCWNQTNLWKAVKVFLAWLSLSELNREREFLWKVSLFLCAWSTL